MNHRIGDKVLLRLAFGPARLNNTYGTIISCYENYFRIELSEFDDEYGRIIQLESRDIENLDLIKRMRFQKDFINYLK